MDGEVIRPAKVKVAK